MQVFAPAGRLWDCGHPNRVIPNPAVIVCRKCSDSGWRRSASGAAIKLLRFFYGLRPLRCCWTSRVFARCLGLKNQVVAERQEAHYQQHHAPSREEQPSCIEQNRFVDRQAPPYARTLPPGEFSPLKPTAARERPIPGACVCACGLPGGFRIPSSWPAGRR